MSNTFKVALFLVATSIISACAQQEEPAPVVLEVEPEPTSTKY